MQINKFDVERLARGERISHESFLAIMSCPAALEQLSRIRQLYEEFSEASAEDPAIDSPARPQAMPNKSPAQTSAAAKSARTRGTSEKGSSGNTTEELSEPPLEMNVSFEELAIYSERGPLSPERLEAVERFLRVNFPEALVERAVAGERRASEAASKAQHGKQAGLESGSTARDNQPPRAANESHYDHRRSPESSRSSRARPRLRGDSEAG